MPFPRVFIFTHLSARAGYDTRSIFKQSLTGLNSEFSFSYTSCPTKAEELSLPYYLLIAGGRIIGFIPLLCEMQIIGFIPLLCEMQSISSRIRTRVAVSISYDENHYLTDTSESISLKMNLIAQPEFKPTYFEAAVTFATTSRF